MRRYIKEKLIDYLQEDGIIHSLDMYTLPKEKFISYFEEKILKKILYKVCHHSIQFFRIPLVCLAVLIDNKSSKFFDVRFCNFVIWKFCNIVILQFLM